MINISEIVTDPDFAQTFTVHRRKGVFSERGRFEPVDSTLPMTGAIIPATTKELAVLPEADRINGAVMVYVTQRLYVTGLLTAADLEEGRLSDELAWHGDRWKIVQVRDFADFGYYRAMATRKAAA